MKDVSDFFVWIWSLIVAVAHYSYEAGRFVIGIIVSLYASSYQYMLTDPHFQSVPYLGKVLISGLVAGIVPLIGLAVLQSFLSTAIRGHLRDSGLDQLSGSSGRASSAIPTRPYITFGDASIQVANLRRKNNNIWSVDIIKDGIRQNFFLSSKQAGSRGNISAFGCLGQVDWGN